MKKIKLRSIIILLITIFLFWYILKDNFVKSIDLIASSNKWLILLSILAYIVYFIIEAYLLKLLIDKSCKKYPFKKVIELNIMTKFFNGITPFSLGGQPLQVYELSKNKVPVTKSILVIVENFIILQITMSIMIILSLIFGYMFELRPNNFLYIMTLIGALITIVSFVITILICVKIELASKIGKNMINLLNKLNIIKDKETTLNEWNSKCIEYQNGFKNLMKDKKFIIKCVCVNFIYMTVFFMIPFFTLKALHITLNINMFYVIILSCFVYISASFIPMPGSSISTEYSFIHYFSLIACETIVIPGVLLYRVITYYLPCIVGGILFNYRDSKRD